MSEHHHQQSNHQMNSRAEQELQDSVTVKDSLRAVLSNYIQREKYQKKTNFDTVIQDRIVSVKGFLKRKKARTFMSLTIFGTPVIFVMSLFGWFSDPIKILTGAGILFALSFLFQAYHAFIIRGNISVNEEYEKIGVQKAFYDIFFETKTSVQLIYYYAFAAFSFFIALAFLNIPVMNMIEAGIFKFGLFWMKGFKITELMFHPKIIYVLIFAYPMSFALGDFMFWKMIYGGVKKRYGDHE